MRITAFLLPGQLGKSEAGPAGFATSFDHQSGLGKIIRERQAWLDQQGTREGRSGLTLVVKPGKRSEYQDVVDALDEVLIHAVKRYTITGAGPEEKPGCGKQTERVTSAGRRRCAVRRCAGGSCNKD